MLWAIAALPGCESTPVVKDAGAPAPSATTTPTGLFGVDLPSSMSKTAVPKTGIRTVSISKNAIAVDSPANQVVAVPDRELASRSGIAAEHKRSGPNDLHIVPLAKALTTSKKGPKEALLYVDAQTPYRVLIEVAYTLGQSEFSKQHFVARNGDRLAVWTFMPPSIGRGSKHLEELDVEIPPGFLDKAASATRSHRPPSGPSAAPSTGPSTGPSSGPPAGPSLAPPKGVRLRLTTLVTGEGIAIKTSSGNVSAGCKKIGSGVAVPKRAGKYDFATLTDCLTRLKQYRKAGEDYVTLSANPDVDFQTIMHVVDAVRFDKNGKPLFSTVHLGVAR